MNWFYLTLFTITSWGIGQVLIKKSLSNISPLWISIISFICSLIVFVPLSLTQGDLELPENKYIFLIVLASFLYYLFYYAIDKGMLSVTGTIVAMYPAITILLSILFLGENLSINQVIAIVLILSGGYLLSKPENKTKVKSKTILIIWAIIGALSIGFADFIAKVVITNTSSATYNFFLAVLSSIAVLSFWKIDKKGRKFEIKSKKYLKIGILGVLLMNVGLLCFNYALQTGFLSLVSILSSGYIGLTIILSSIFLKEKLNTIQIFAVLLMIVGIGLITISA